MSVPNSFIVPGVPKAGVDEAPNGLGLLVGAPKAGVLLAPNRPPPVLAAPNVLPPNSDGVDEAGGRTCKQATEMIVSRHTQVLEDMRAAGY